MKLTRHILLLVSFALVLCLLGGGMAVKVGAGENSFRQVVMFSEILTLVRDNYVDQLEADKLLNSAYEGMLGGLDAHGAYLSPEEVAEWKGYESGGLADPGITVLQAGRALQVVAVAPDSPAAEAGIEVGDQIRDVDGRPVRNLSLDQAWRLILGEPGSRVKLDILHPQDGFRRETLELVRAARLDRPYELTVTDRGIALLKVNDLSRVSDQELAGELDDVRSRGVERLLVDLRNVADSRPGQAGTVAGLFAAGPLLELHDRGGRVVEEVDAPDAADAWPGPLAVLVNGATAGSAEALASVIQNERGGLVLGEPTYGLGSEPRLYEMENGSGLLVSAELWETASGGRWNGDGVAPDHVIRGKGTEFLERFADQLVQALDFMAELEDQPAAKPEAA